MKIAITGKGGVGKTTFAATLARLYAEEGKHVLAADVDPDANLGLALGFSEEELEEIVPVSYTHLSLSRSLYIRKIGRAIRRPRTGTRQYSAQTWPGSVAGCTAPSPET